MEENSDLPETDHSESIDSSNLNQTFDQIEQDIIDQRTDEIGKAELKFRSYGIITMWIFPLFLFILFSSGGAIFVLLGAIASYFIERSFIRRGHISKFGRGLAFLPYHLIRLSFGANISKKNPAQLRYWWFLLFGWFIATIVGALIILSAYLIIPLIFIIYQRKRFLAYIFLASFLPRGEYFALGRIWVPEKKEIEKKEAIKKRLDQEFGYIGDNSYYYFYPPNRISKLTAYFTILFIPVGFIAILLLISNIFVNDSALKQSINETGTITIGYGLIGIIPYFIFMSLRKKRLTRVVTTKMAEGFVKTISHSTLSSIPMLSGDYFLEENSKELYMHYNFGAAEIFKDGRIFTLLILPISLIASIFTNFVIDTENNDLTPQAFLENFRDNLENPVFGFWLLVGIPFLIAIILPLIWVLTDAEIKRATWKRDESDPDKKEISSVEDLGTMLNRYFGLFIGVSAITNLTTLVREIVGETATTFDSYLIFAIIMIFGAVMILPGAFFMAFRYFSTGDHAAGVNYLRYNLSQDPEISVGTISHTYVSDKSLPEPQSELIKSQIVV